MGLPGVVPTPGCEPPAVDPELAVEGHFCAQAARESRRGRANFLLSAQSDGAPVIEPPDMATTSTRTNRTPNRRSPSP